MSEIIATIQNDTPIQITVDSSTNISATLLGD
jgi:hypothetical protein